MQSLKGDAVWDFQSLDEYYYEWYTGKNLEFHILNKYNKKGNI